MNLKCEIYSFYCNYLIINFDKHTKLTTMQEIENYSANAKITNRPTANYAN
jgi:hypothetical protein